MKKHTRTLLTSVLALLALSYSTGVAAQAAAPAVETLARAVISVSLTNSAGPVTGVGVFVADNQVLALLRGTTAATEAAAREEITVLFRAAALRDGRSLIPAEYQAQGRVVCWTLVTTQGGPADDIVLVRIALAAPPAVGISPVSVDGRPDGLLTVITERGRVTDARIGGQTLPVRFAKPIPRLSLLVDPLGGWSAVFNADGRFVGVGISLRQGGAEFNSAGLVLVGPAVCGPLPK